MRTIQRAYLYVTRKKGKSILLFFILLVMATFVLTGLSTKKASQEAQKNLREALGGRFELAVDLSESNPYFKQISDDEGNMEIYTEFPITPEIIDDVMTVDGIKHFDASNQTLVSTDLALFSGNVPLKGELNHKIYARTVAGTEQNSFFQSGTMKMVKGNHITQKDYHAAVISKDLADKNSLELGDSISLQADQTAKVQTKIIGIYEILKPDSAYANIATYEKLENQIFIDSGTLQNLLNMPAGFYDATFTVYDPAQLDKIISEVNRLSSIDWRAFKITTDNQTYLDAAAPLQKLQDFVSSIIFAIVLVSAVILSLILTLWGKSRIHETGVFLSLGIGKMKIASQYLTEVLIIAAFAFGCSYFTSSAAANRLANGLLQQNIPASSDQQNDGIVIDVKDGYGDDVTISRKDKKSDAKIESSNTEIKNPDTKNFVTQIEDSAEIKDSATEPETYMESIPVAIDFINVLQLCLIGFIIIILSVGVSSLSVMRLKPREILSKMS